MIRNLAPALALLTCWLSCVSASSQDAQEAASSESVVARARELHAQHRDAEAVPMLDSYLQHHASDAGALTELAEIYIALQNPVAAEPLLWRALNVSPELPAANLILGHLLLTQHKDPEAMDRFETVLTSNPRNADARSGENDAATELAISMRRDHRPKLALKALEHAREALPDDPQLLLELGIQANELGLTPEALDALHAARGLRPADPDILYALARAEINAQQMPAAEADLRTYLAKRPTDASAHFGLGRVLEALQRTDEARAEFTRSLELQPAQTESNYELGQMALETGELDRAEPLFAKTLARDPKHGGALTGMGILAFRRKQYDKADSWLAQAIEAAPNYPPAHYYRGLALARLGRKQESDKELQTATELDRREQAPPGPPPQP
jgi:tetratricopeptide (TPR) repeat protein